MERNVVEPDPIERPLAGIMVIDLVASPLSGIARGLRELGADVVRLEIAGRGALPAHDARDQLAYWTANLGKQIEALPADAPELAEWLARADIIIEDLSVEPDGAPLIDLPTMDWPAIDWPAIDWDALARANPALVHMTASGFGLGNSFSHWQWTDAVLHALSSALSRSGIRGREPLLPPGELALQCAVSQGLFVAMAALTQALVHGRGGRVDYAALDGAMQALDPGFGIVGSATFGRPARLLAPSRPVKGIQYPIIAAADGHVRLVVLAPRQWIGLHRMMGEPPEFADPSYRDMMVRFKCPNLLPALGRFFADKTRAESEALAREYGVPLAGLLSLNDCLAADHIRARGVFRMAELPGGLSAPFPDGLLVVDGRRMGPLHDSAPPAPRLAPAPAPAAAIAPAPTPDASPAPKRPLEGIRVLDLGVIVVGAETGRLLADLGAEVIKVESQAFPDGSRQTYLKIGLSGSFGAGHRNKRSLGLNLKSDEGKALFRDLIAKADVVLTNFKPGTMEALGLGYDELSAINPRLIAVESSAFGATGPWAKRMGYGPLVRAAAGLTAKWCYPGDADGFSDSVTIYPDHVGGRIGAAAAMALLLRRMRTGRGGQVDVSQAELMLSHLATEIAGTALGLPGIEAAPDAPWGVFPAEGEDQWCVVTVRGDADWQGLARVIGEPALHAATRADRLTNKAALEAHLADWIGRHGAEEAAQILQAARVPAARMLRIADQPDHPYFTARGVFRTDHHALLPDPMIAETRPAVWPAIADAAAGPAPLMGEDTMAVMREWLQLDESELARLAAEGVLETVPEAIRAMIADGSYKENAI